MNGSKYFSLNTGICVQHGSPNRGPPSLIIFPADTFVNWVTKSKVHPRTGHLDPEGE